MAFRTVSEPRVPPPAATPPTPRRRGRIHVLTESFRLPSETFVVDHVLGLRSYGWDVHVACLERDAAAVTRLGSEASDVPLIERCPHRRYISADLAVSVLSESDVELANLLTAIDVLYHIVDDLSLASTLRHFLKLGAPGATFLFTDALHEGCPAEHVRFRSLNQWKQLLHALGWRVIDAEPVFALSNRLSPLARRVPGLAGAVQHVLDAPLLRGMPWLATNRAVLARREDGGEQAR